MQPQYEYYLLRLKHPDEFDIHRTNDKVNELGKVGWRLTAAMDSVLYFTRMIEKRPQYEEEL
jgi:hypothetical protein